jgi:two-component system sensor histidine kinase KdpD
VTGPVLGIVGALAAVVLVNWYLVPPYRTFEVASPDNVVALVVFAFVSGVVAVLSELNTRIRAGAVRTQQRAGLLGDVVSKGDDGDPAVSLERVRVALDLDRVSLTRTESGTTRVLATAGTGPDPSVPVLDVGVSGGYRLVGSGPERMAEDPEFMQSLASAAVRAYESDLMDSERRRAEELAAVDSARTALLASVGHDLRTPLAGLRLAVDALRAPDTPLDAETTEDLLETVDESTTRLDELITNLLDMSRLEAGVLIAMLEPTAVDAVVATALLAWPHAAVSVDIDDALPLVLTDPMLLERVVENLVSNAIRHAAPTPDRPVAVSAFASGGTVVIDVADRGPGLRREGPLLPRAASPGGGADSSTGLGLAIVSAFCDAVHARLDFLDTSGGGLTVRVTVPVAEAAS